MTECLLKRGCWLKEDLAADLAKVISGSAHDQYKKPDFGLLLKRV
jgi:hypothetical protein